MNEDYLIDIVGTMETPDDVDTVSLMTRGSFLEKNGSYYISYRETKATGYEGNITTVKVEAEDRVSMLRTGPTPSQLVVERGRRHVCHYDTGFGPLSLGVQADAIKNRLTGSGGQVVFSYTLDSGDAQLSRNEVKITVSVPQSVG